MSYTPRHARRRRIRLAWSHGQRRGGPADPAPPRRVAAAVQPLPVWREAGHGYRGGGWHF